MQNPTIEEIVKEMKKEGIVLQKENGKWWQIYGDWRHHYTEREIHGLYKVFRLKGSKWKRIVKENSNSQNRAKTKQLLHHEKYDHIPQNTPVFKEDPWNHN